jgi:hypothetical protein
MSEPANNCGQCKALRDGAAKVLQELELLIKFTRCGSVTVGDLHKAEAVSKEFREVLWPDQTKETK